MVQILRRSTVVRVYKAACISLLALGATALIGAGTGVIRWDQLNPLYRHGNGLYGQASDGTGTSGHVATFDTNGNLTDGGVAGSALSLQTNGVTNGSQSILNLAAGMGISLTDNGSGMVTLVNTGTTGTGSASYTPITLSSFTQSIRGSGSYTATNPSGKLVVSYPANLQVDFRTASTGTPAMTVTAAALLLPCVYGGVNDKTVTDIEIWDSVGGKGMVFGINCDGSMVKGIPNPVVSGIGAGGGTNYYIGSFAIYGTSVIWMRLVDDGTTNRVFSISPDGLTYTTVYTQSRTTFLTTPNTVGINCGSYGNVGSCTFLSFTVTTP